MIPESQRRVFAFLARPETHGGNGGQVEQVHTHISALFLAGGRVLKAKRAVELPYADQRELATRERLCRHEVEINSPGAPGLYEGVVAVTEESDGTLALDGAGTPVEWLVVMNRFDDSQLFSRLLSKAELDRHQMQDLAEAVVAAHDRAPVVTDDPEADGFAQIIANNRRAFADQAARLGEADVAAFMSASDAALERLRPLLAQRAKAGKVRHCHGDLHLRNVVLWEGKPTLFDAIDFNDLFVKIDVLYDLAFLLMDLDFRGQRRLAAMTFNHWMEFTGDTGGLAALPLFMATRAGIRAFVQATAGAEQSDPEEARRLLEDARAYLALGMGYLDPPGPRLVAVGGLSGSGKSRLAREVAGFVGAAPGAIVLRTDVLRKRIMGRKPYEPLGAEGYTPEMHAKTYALLKQEAFAALAAGHSVVLDGVHAKPEERIAARAIAEEAGVPFDGLWVRVPVDVSLERIRTRVRNPSDVTEEVRLRQEEFDLGTIDWAIIDASGPKRQTVAAGRRALGL